MVNHIGEIKLNNKGTPMKVIHQFNANEIEIEFQDSYKYKTKVFYQNFKKGVVLNPYDKTIFSIGCLGVGKYRAKANNQKTLEYNIWMSILQRCYVEKYRYKYPAYEDCIVCDEWLIFQNFAQWYNDNIYYINDERMHIDKDILINDNKIYSPDRCIIVPQRVNMIFMNKAKNRDSDLPNAIYRCVNGYQASYNGKSLGVFKTVEGAINAHDSAKKIHIKQVVEDYGDKLPPKVQNALITWDNVIAA
jgi:hypothetical protein